MPPSKLNHPIRQVRVALGPQYSQGKFAELVGTSRATIQSIELGRLHLSKSLATRICAATGAEPSSLMDKDGNPLDVTGQPYTRESFKKLRKLKDLPPETVAELHQRAALYLDVLLEAAAKNKKFAAAMTAFSEWVELTRKEFGLEKATRELMRQRTAWKHGQSQGHSEWTSARGFTLSAEEFKTALDGIDLAELEKKKAALLQKARHVSKTRED